MFNIELKTLIDFSDEDVVNGVLTVPEGVEIIKYINNFSCRTSDIKKIILPKTLKSIDKYAFSNSIFRSVEEIELKDGLTNIGNYAFYMCNSLNKIVIPKTVVEIGESAFKNCYSLRKIELPNNLKILENDLFFNCEKLSDIVFPNKLEVIKKNCFFNCNLQQTINLPNTLKIIEINAFDCKNQVDVVLDKNNLIKNKNIVICEKNYTKPIKFSETENKYIFKYNLEKYNLFDICTLATYFYIVGDTKQLNELFKNANNININIKLVSALQKDLKNNLQPDMHFSIYY